MTDYFTNADGDYFATDAKSATKPSAVSNAPKVDVGEATLAEIGKSMSSAIDRYGKASNRVVIRKFVIKK